MITLMTLLGKAKEAGASDIFIVSGQPLSYKAQGTLFTIDDEKVMPETAQRIIEEAYALAGRSMDALVGRGDDDFAASVSALARLRINAYRQRGSYAAVIRLINYGMPDYQQMGIPEGVMDVARNTKGLVLVTGPAGNGKSTTLACIIDRINQTRSGHIITVEEPIEFLYRNKRSIVSQREVMLDTSDYVTALRASLRQAPDVILVGEMRDYETTRTAMTAAETGHLVISTLHTLGASNSVDRIIDLYPYNQQYQIRTQLAMVLRSVISQQLVQTADGGMAPAFEIMHVNNAIRTMIRESKVHQIDSAIAMGANEGMVGMDASLLDLYKRKVITADTALRHATNYEQMQKRLG